MSTALSWLMDKVHRLLLLPKRCNRRSREIPLFPCSTLIELCTHASNMTRTHGSLSFCMLRSRQNAQSFNLNAFSLPRLTPCVGLQPRKQLADSSRENKQRAQSEICVLGLGADSQICQVQQNVANCAPSGTKRSTAGGWKISGERGIRFSRGTLRLRGK